MMEALKPLVLGQSLAGAGGGGFLYLLTREPRQRQAVLRVLDNTPVSSTLLLYQYFGLLVNQNRVFKIFTTFMILTQQYSCVKLRLKCKE